MTEPKQNGNESGASKPDASPQARAWFRRYPVATFLGALVSGFMVSSFDQHVRDGDLLEAAWLTVVMLFGLLALSSRRKTLVVGFALVTPALAGKWVYHWRPDLVHPWFYLVPALLFMVLVIAQLLRFILRAPRINSEVLCAGVAGYLMLGLLWAMAYILTARLIPNAFVFSVGPAASDSMKGFTALYYSLITLTTVGYGDIVPVTGPTRMLAMMEAMVGTFYMAMLVARLVSLYSSGESSVKANDSINP